MKPNHQTNNKSKKKKKLETQLLELQESKGFICIQRIVISKNQNRPSIKHSVTKKLKIKKKQQQRNYIKHLTRRMGCFINNRFKGVVNHLAIHQEPEITFYRRLPLRHRLRIRLLLPFLRLVPRMQFHRDEPHFLHKPLLLSRISLLRLLCRRGRYNNRP